MRSERSSLFKKAMRMLDEGHAQSALAVGHELLRSDDEAYKLSGHLCVGLIYEEGGNDLVQDLDRATYHYHHASALSPDPIPFSYLARATMKRGPSGYTLAYKYLVEARKLGEPSEVLLGFATYYRTKPDKDLTSAKRYYLRAALQGRFAGFFGYSSVSRELGQKVRALLMDCLRLVVGPFLALLIGRAAQDRF